MLRTQAWFRHFPFCENGPGSESDATLICFPHAGGAANSFRALARTLAAVTDTVAVQYPGRQDRHREPPITDIGTLAELIAEQVLTEYQGPYAFFGHSMGAVVAYEAARLLRRPPVHLFVSACAAPSAAPLVRDRLTGDHELLAAVLELKGTDPRVLKDLDVQNLAMKPLRADYQACEAYRWRPGPSLDCPVTVLYGDSDPLVTSDTAEAWSGLTTDRTSVHQVSGGHFYLDRRAAEVAEVIRAALVPGRPSAASLAG